ncbi:MAG: CocE/NonD family hydrolase [Acidimicrobiales bacterium]|nr:CocE/NonD family hydrolase [Acidimicrobiales bacterium]
MTRPGWFDYDRPADHDVSVTTVEVPLRNGMHLVADLATPTSGGTPAEGPFPGLVAHYTPYGRARFRPAVEWWARHGYLTICCDIRGSGDSPGRFPGCLSQGENEDNYDVIEWLAAHPACSGKVGQYGVSYGGMSALRVASLRPPHLSAIAPEESYSSYYRHTAFPGGLAAGSGRDWANGVPGFTNNTVTTEFQKLLWAVHPLIDEFWRQVDIDTKYGEIAVPVLGFGGWFDNFKEGMVENYLGLAEHAHLVMGPWTHGSPDTMPIEPAPLGTVLAFFDHHLAGLDAPLPAARVTSYELPRDTSRGWVELKDFPPPDASGLRLSLTADGRLALDAGPAGERSYDVDPDDGPAAIRFPPGGPLPDDPGVDLRDSDERRLTFSSEPFPDDVVVIGIPTLHLSAALSAPDGALIAKLMDVSPDGRVNQASVGYLRATHRLGHDRVAPLVPGEMSSFELRLEPLHWRFGAGHRLRVSLTSGDVPAIAPEAPAGTVTVGCGSGGSELDLQVLAEP